MRRLAARTIAACNDQTFNWNTYFLSLPQTNLLRAASFDKHSVVEFKSVQTNRLFYVMAASYKSPKNQKEFLKIFGLSLVQIRTRGQVEFLLQMKCSRQ